MIAVLVCVPACPVANMFNHWSHQHSYPMSSRVSTEMAEHLVYTILMFKQASYANLAWPSFPCRHNEPLLGKKQWVLP